MWLAMIGTGYVGLVSGACFSEFGVNVTCVDKDESKINTLLQGEIPIYEPGLDKLVADNVAAGRLSFTTDLEAAVKQADVVFIAVGTPSRRGDGHADLSYVYAAAEEIGQAMEGYTVVVTKSTVPVGTGREVHNRLSKVAPEGDFDVVSNPEFLREGSAIEDFMRPDRVVIGSESQRAREVMEKLYRPLFLLKTPIVHTEIQTAELIKYAANSFLATKIAFINEMADLCEKCDANVQDVATGMGLDGRIGGKFLHAGPGFGGSCFPKDIRALSMTAKTFDAPVSIVESVIESNRLRKIRMAKKVIDAFDGNIEGKTIAVLGVTFKPNTDDMRESPSLDIIPALQKNGAKIKAYDPAGQYEAEKMLPDVSWCKDSYATMEDADAVLILTEWNQFRALDLNKMKQLLKSPIVVDLRNIYPRAEMLKAGFIYHSIGRRLKAEELEKNLRMVG